MASSSRLRALEAVQRENTALTSFLFDTVASDQKSQKVFQDLLSMLEKQDRNLESQLSEVQTHVLDQRAALADAKLAFERHLSTHGRAHDGHEQTFTSISRLAALEDKKHASLVSRGQAEHSSSSVKDKINVIRRERVLFEEMTKKYRKELGRIGGDVVRVVRECTERMGRAKERRACVERLREVARREEAAWATGWRAQILRMEAFAEQEGRVQRERVEEKRARAVALLKQKGSGETPVQVQAKVQAKVQDTEARVGIPENADVSLRSVMARVLERVLGGASAGDVAEPHVAIVRAFEGARARARDNVEVTAAGARPIEEVGADEVVQEGIDVGVGVGVAANVEAGTAAEATSKASEPIDRYRTLIKRLVEAAKLSPVVTREVEGDAGLLVELALVELYVLVAR